MSFEIGVMTFAEITKDPATGALPSPRQRVRETIEQAQVADQVGLDVFGVGGVGFPLSRAAFLPQTSPSAGLLVGSPQEVIDKLLAYHEVYGLNRVIIQMGFGGMPQKEHLAAIELLGTEVAPIVRRETAIREGKAS